MCKGRRTHMRLSDRARQRRRRLHVPSQLLVELPELPEPPAQLPSFPLIRPHPTSYFKLKHHKHWLLIPSPAPWRGVEDARVALVRCNAPVHVLRSLHAVPRISTTHRQQLQLPVLQVHCAHGVRKAARSGVVRRFLHAMVSAVRHNSSTCARRCELHCAM